MHMHTKFHLHVHYSLQVCEITSGCKENWPRLFAVGGCHGNQLSVMRVMYNV